jgi:hypothetical protein
MYRYRAMPHVLSRLCVVTWKPWRDSAAAEKNNIMLSVRNVLVIDLARQALQGRVRQSGLDASRCSQKPGLTGR